MNFGQYLKTSAREIDREAEKLLRSWQDKVASVNPKLIPFAKAFIEANRGGKKLRGMFTKLGFELGGGKKTTEILKASAAYEIFNTAILAHDDIVDLSPLRRGKLTLYHQLGANHYGQSQAMILADAGFFLAMQLILKASFPEKRKIAALAFFSQTAIDTYLGEILDVELPHLKLPKREKDILTIAKLKTGAYTIRGPMVLGGLLAGAKQSLLTNFAKFGENLGIAYQIQDDILGVFGDEKTLGKSVTSDIEEDKNTLLISYAQAHASKSQKRILEKHYGKGKISKKGFREVKRVFEQTGSLAYSQKRAQKYVARAKKVIPEITKDPEMKALLTEFADFLLTRQK